MLPFFQQEPRKPSYAEICQRIREAPPTHQAAAEARPASGDEARAPPDSSEPRAKEVKPAAAAAGRPREAWRPQTDGGGERLCSEPAATSPSSSPSEHHT